MAGESRELVDLDQFQVLDNGYLSEKVSPTSPSSAENSTDFDFRATGGSSSSRSDEVSALLESSIETTSRRSHFEFMPQFEHSSYDFMVPEGTNNVSTNLAVISYMGKKGKPMPVFKISFDRMRWFEIGNITTKELDDYIEYKVMINQRSDVYVQYSLTKGGTYKFSIEAHDDGSMQTASISVDVLSLLPTTRRSTTTPAATTPASTTTERTTPTTPADLLQTTTQLITTSTAPEIFSNSALDSSAINETSSEASTSESPVQDNTTTSAGVPPTLPIAPLVPVSKTVSNELRAASESDDDSSENEDLVLTALNREVTGEPPNLLFPLDATSSEQMMATEATLLKEELTSNKQVDGSSESLLPKIESAEELTSDDEESERKDDEVTISHEGSGTSTTSAEVVETTRGDLNGLPAFSSTEKPLEEDTSNKTAFTGISSTAAGLESLNAEAEEIELVFEGTKNGSFNMENSLKSGDLVRGLAISVKITPKGKNSYTNLSLDRTDIVDIRPKLLFPGNKAYLFVKDLSLLSSPITVKIMAERPTSASIKELVLQGSRSKSPSSALGSAATNKSVVEEYEFSIAEDAPSGSTVGQIKDGESKRVVGPPGLFSLIGSDLILSCPNEDSCLDYEKQKMHHVLLVDAQGKRSAPVYVKVKVQDVNDNQPRLEASDNIIRLSNNKLIMPFIVQVLDADEPTSNKNHLTTSGSAASFLGVKEISANLYQIDVVGFAPAGHHQLEFTVSDGDSSSELTVEVQVQNSRSHAHFRRTKYSRSITADKVHQGNQLLQVELEGVPIDEARFLILQGNPGWLTIDDYGGRVGIAKFISPVESGTYLVDIGAVDRQSNALLAQTQLEIKVVGGAEAEKKMFSQNFFRRTLDRGHLKVLNSEESTEFSVPFKMKKVGEVRIEAVFAIDENGQQSDFDMSAVTVKKHSVVFKKNSLDNLRAVSVELVSEGEKAMVMLSLTSSAEFIENRRKESARPAFPRPWSKETPIIELNIPEELPEGYVIYTLPALNPLDGSVVPSMMEGNMKEAFELDPTTGAVSIAHRLDVDTMNPSERTFSLKFTAGSNGYKSVAELRITVVNMDDNAPIIEKEGLNNELPLPENLPPLTVIARLQVVDKDGLGNVDEFLVEKSGIGSEMYSASIVNGSLVVAVAENGTLDREVMERHTIHLTVHDADGNQDSATLHVVLLDVNDNAPRFLQDQYAMQVVDNWPSGIVVDRLKATDIDAGKNARVIYSLASGSSKYFSIDASTGELTVSGELAGAAREQPYELVVLAEDTGSPSLSTSVRIKVKVSEPLLEREGEKGQVIFINPPVEFVLKLKEDTPVNDHVYIVKARLAGIGLERMNIKYSLRDSMHSSSTQQHFDIDESSGEVYVSKALDYEDTKFYTRTRVSMDKLERRIARLWRRLGGGRRRERRSKKDESSSSLPCDDVVVLNNKTAKTKNVSPSTRHRHQSDSTPSRDSRSKDLSRALVRLYAYARLRSLQNLIIAESTPASNSSTVTDLDNLELGRPMDQFSFLSSLPQLSIPRLKNQDIDKLCLSRESGYLTNSPWEFSSSSETLRQQSRNVYKSKCVTCVFEAAHAGLGVLLDDILAEFNRWFVGRKMLVIASELHFSVPLARRCRKQELVSV
ncbi:cadherin domain protein [Teladorsagia circumcincta]|uniref:Cadherin domain protein n=1 Tax=Teladorsagia circumcincta TaxID=45464 RepID=A0A2G9UCX8_TELCI|nr:cadherin domain protein [Teladorsagia circumcincta]